MKARIVVTLAVGLAAAACQHSASPAAPTTPGVVVDAGGVVASSAEVLLPFHSDVKWEKNMVSPGGQCTQPLPDSYVYLWLTENSGTHTSTHLGEGSYANNLCVFGRLTNPDGPPGKNGVPAGWYDVWVEWTAANGDKLRATGQLDHWTAPPGTPGMKFVETLHFVGDGTGRFANAEGDITSVIDPAARTVVYDGTIRYGKK